MAIVDIKNFCCGRFPRRIDLGIACVSCFFQPPWCPRGPHPGQQQNERLHEYCGPLLGEYVLNEGSLAARGALRVALYGNLRKDRGKPNTILASMEEAGDCVESTLGYTDEEQTCRDGGGSGQKQSSEIVCMLSNA